MKYVESCLYDISYIFNFKFSNADSGARAREERERWKNWEDEENEGVRNSFKASDSEKQEAFYGPFKNHGVDFSYDDSKTFPQNMKVFRSRFYDRTGTGSSGHDGIMKQFNAMMDSKDQQKPILLWIDTQRYVVTEDMMVAFMKRIQELR